MQSTHAQSSGTTGSRRQLRRTANTRRLRSTLSLAVAFCIVSLLAPAGDSPAVAAPQSDAAMNADIDKQLAERRTKFQNLCKGAEFDIAANNLAAAATKLKEAVTVAEPLSEGEPQLLALTRLGDVYVKQKNFKEAEKVYKQAYDTNIEQYRGNFPVLLDTANGLKEVYSATGRQKDADKIVKEAKEARVQRYSVAGIDNADLFAAYYESLRSALSKNDTKAAVKLFKYPFSVTTNTVGAKGKPVSTTKIYKSEAEMLADLRAVFNPMLVKLLGATPEKQLWCRDQGVMLGSGQLWLVNVPQVIVGGKPAYRLQSITVNK